jgi:hypothetical protein
VRSFRLLKPLERLWRRFLTSRVHPYRARKTPNEVKSSDNHQRAVDTASRLARALRGACSIYAERGGNGNRRVQMAEVAPPDPAKWYPIATIQPDGSYSFKAELFDDPSIVVPSIGGWGPGD